MVGRAAAYLQDAGVEPPACVVVLGSGLGGFEFEIAPSIEIPYQKIPGWPHPSPSAAGHAGRLFSGKIGNERVVVLSGRVHLYEGYTAAKTAYGVKVLGRLGAKRLMVTNAAGAVNPDFPPGGLALIADHINLQGTNPLIGPNDESAGPRFPDMSEAYSLWLRGLARNCADTLGLELREGVYAAVPGPNYETPAEVRYLRTIGADLVGMSTVAEVIAARHVGLEVLGISCITNRAAGLSERPLAHNEVLETGRSMRASLTTLLKAVIEAAGSEGVAVP